MLDNPKYITLYDKKGAPTDHDNLWTVANLVDYPLADHLRALPDGRIASLYAYCSPVQAKRLIATTYGARRLAELGWKIEIKPCTEGSPTNFNCSEIYYTPPTE